MKRRSVLTVAGFLMLGGCGFTPLYGKLSPTTDVSTELSQVYVANIQGRYGQQLRLALQKNLSGAGPENPQRYTLRVNSGANTEAIDIHQDNTSGRNRVTGSAHWQLFTVEQSPQLLTQGDVNTLDGYNTTFEQYFAQTLNDETAKGRVAQTLAQNLTQQLAIWFRSHNTPSKNTQEDLPRYINTDRMPSDNGTSTEKVGADGFPASATGRISQGTITN
ncbi:LPS assembly lipoprotein LptE [Gluconobacter japonicus]|uniref:LPS assembly lipoprotein LptE n=1 Tax=Gluconobacter japonicus TaxID=376620 RepID=UPI001B8C5D18|nr:LPS assembly lipoprotein LptE [Gluconobacter japonicus]MBS1050533.1 hypothetical protein [Gluconobacter japonicus]